MVGAGTAGDPRRPLFAPLPGERSAISGFTYQISDNGQSALVQFVARSRADFQSLLAAARADVKVFERGKATLDEVQAEFRRVKAGFDVRQFAGRKRSAGATVSGRPGR